MCIMLISGGGLGSSLGGGRDFDSLSAALGGGYSTNSMERDFRGPPPNNNTNNNGRDHNMSDTIIIKNVSLKRFQSKFKKILNES